MARPTAAPAAAAAKQDATVIKNVEEVEAARPSAPRKQLRPAPEPEPLPRSYTEELSVAAQSRTVSGYNIVAPEAALDDAKNFVRDLSQADKLAFIGAAATVLMCFLPWKETAADGEILGLMSLGALVFLLNLVAMGAVFVRVKNAMPRLHPVIPWLVQLGTLCFGLVWCLVYMKLASDDRMVPALIGNETVAISSPSIGVYLSLLTQIVGLGGTLMGLKEKPA